MSVDADRRQFDKETVCLIEEIVKQLKDTQTEECAQHNPIFSLKNSSPTANSQCVKGIHNKTFNSLAVILNCKVGSLVKRNLG